MLIAKALSSHIIKLIICIFYAWPSIKRKERAEGRRSTEEEIQLFRAGIRNHFVRSCSAPTENAEWKSECCMHCTVSARSIQKNLNIQIQRNVIALGHVKTITKSLENIEKRVEWKKNNEHLFRTIFLSLRISCYAERINRQANNNGLEAVVQSRICERDCEWLCVCAR